MLSTSAADNGSNGCRLGMKISSRNVKCPDGGGEYLEKLYAH